MARETKKLSERIQEKLTRDGDCIIWKGAMAGGSPVIAKLKDGKWRNMNIRAMQGVKRYPDTTLKTRFKTSCGNPRCVTPAHIILGSQSFVTRRCRSGTKKANTENNIAIFKAMVQGGVEEAVTAANLSHGTTTQILYDNMAMYPYFYTLLNEVCDVEAIKSSDKSHALLAETYNISLFAVEFLRKYNFSPIYDLDMFERLLMNCEVHKEHLIWVGEEVDDVVGMLYKAAFGAAIPNGAKKVCDYDHCVNPYHYEVIKNV